MYNDTRPFISPELHRDLPPRVTVGRSCPTFAQSSGGAKESRPREERQGRRLCDGSLPNSDNDMPRGGRSTPRNEGCSMNEGCGNHGDGCGNADGGWGLESHPLAMVYSPLQHFRELYEPEIALGRGTLFAELDLPFEGDKNKNGGGCRSC